MLLVIASRLQIAHADTPPRQPQKNLPFDATSPHREGYDAVKAAAQGYSLTLVFVQNAVGPNTAITGIPVTITDSKGTRVLKTTVQGPYLLVRLPPGQYNIRATFQGIEQVHQATLKEQKTTTHLIFDWK
jgi:hypothetical protein